MDIREEILNKYQEFNKYLESVNLDEMRKEFSRQELNEFKSELYKLKTRSLAYEIGEMTKQMKVEEYPELNGIHRYPVLREIDFLTEKEKLELDKFLIKFVPNRDYVQSFWRAVKSPKKVELLQTFLIERGVLEERYVVSCPNCHQNHLSKMMTKDERNKLENLIQNKADYEDLEVYLEFTCDECFSELEPEKIDEFSMKTYLKLVMERDKSLDNV